MPKRPKVLIYGDSMASAFSLLNARLFRVCIRSFPGATGWTLASQEFGLPFLIKKAKKMKRPYDIVVLVVHHNDNNVNCMQKHELIQTMLTQCESLQVVIASLVPDLPHCVSSAENPHPLVHLFRPREFGACWLGEWNSHERDVRYWTKDGHLNVTGKRLWTEYLENLLQLLSQLRASDHVKSRS